MFYFSKAISYCSFHLINFLYRISQNSEKYPIVECMISHSIELIRKFPHNDKEKMLEHKNAMSYVILWIHIFFSPSKPSEFNIDFVVKGDIQTITKAYYNVPSINFNPTTIPIILLYSEFYLKMIFSLETWHIQSEC